MEIDATGTVTVKPEPENDVIHMSQVKGLYVYVLQYSMSSIDCTQLFLHMPQLISFTHVCVCYFMCFDVT